MSQQPYFFRFGVLTNVVLVIITFKCSCSAKSTDARIRIKLIFFVVFHFRTLKCVERSLFLLFRLVVFVFSSRFNFIFNEHIVVAMNESKVNFYFSWIKVQIFYFEFVHCVVRWFMQSISLKCTDSFTSTMLFLLFLDFGWCLFEVSDSHRKKNNKKRIKIKKIIVEFPHQQHI